MPTPRSRYRLLHFLAALLVTAGAASAQSLQIPEETAWTNFGELKITYPKDWTKRKAEIGRGRILESPISIEVGGQPYKSVISLGKEPHGAISLPEFQEALSDQLSKTAEAINAEVQKVIAEVAEEKNLSLALKEVGKWSVTPRKHDGIEVLRTTFNSVQAINGNPVPFHTDGFWHMSGGVAYVVTFTYPTMLEKDAAKFSEWVMENIKITRPKDSLPASTANSKTESLSNRDWGKLVANIAGGLLLITIVVGVITKLAKR